MLQLRRTHIDSKAFGLTLMVPGDGVKAVCEIAQTARFLKVAGPNKACILQPRPHSDGQLRGWRVYQVT